MYSKKCISYMSPFMIAIFALPIVIGGVSDAQSLLFGMKVGRGLYKVSERGLKFYKSLLIAKINDNYYILNPVKGKVYRFKLIGVESSKYGKYYIFRKVASARLHNIRIGFIWGGILDYVRSKKIKLINNYRFIFKKIKKRKNRELIYIINEKRKVIIVIYAKKIKKSKNKKKYKVIKMKVYKGKAYEKAKKYIPISGIIIRSGEGKLKRSPKKSNFKSRYNIMRKKYESGNDGHDRGGEDSIGGFNGPAMEGAGLRE